MVHLFAEYPVHAKGIMIPMQVPFSSVDILSRMLRDDYQIEILPHTLNGKSGYKDQHGRFFMYRYINTPDELGAFMEEIGAGEDAITNMVRSLQ